MSNSIHSGHQQFVDQTSPVHVSGNSDGIEGRNQLGGRKAPQLGFVSGHASRTPWKSAHQAALQGLSHLLFPRLVVGSGAQQLGAIHADSEARSAGADEIHAISDDGADGHVGTADSEDHGQGACGHSGGLEDAQPAIKSWSALVVAGNAHGLDQQGAAVVPVVVLASRLPAVATQVGRGLGNLPMSNSKVHSAVSVTTFFESVARASATEWRLPTASGASVGASAPDADDSSCGRHSSGLHLDGLAETGPVESGVEAFTGNTGRSGNDGTLFDWNLSSLEPVLNVLTQNLSVGSRRQLGRRTQLIDGSLDAGFRCHDSSSSQSSLQDTMQSSLHASIAKCFAMKKTVGEQAQAFREWKEWSVKEMALKCGTSRQNIETLEGTGGRVPRYVKKLAEVMGTTVDVLLEGRYRAGKAPAPVVEPPPPDENSLDHALSVISRAVSTEDPIAKLSLELLFAVIERNTVASGTSAQQAEALPPEEVSAVSGEDNRRSPTDKWLKGYQPPKGVTANNEQSLPVPDEKRSGQ